VNARRFSAVSVLCFARRLHIGRPVFVTVRVLFYHSFIPWNLEIRSASLTVKRIVDLREEKTNLKGLPGKEPPSLLVLSSMGK